MNTWAPSVGIIGTGRSAPNLVVTTEELAVMAGVPPAWALEHVGARERRRLAPGERLAWLAVEAASRAVLSTHIRTTDIGLIVVATSTPDRVAPSTAAEVAKALELEVPAFDVNGVCAGFMYALSMAAAFISSTDAYSELPRYALVIGADAYSRITDDRRRDNVFFGDGAGAVILSSRVGRGLYLSLGGARDRVDAFQVPRGEAFVMNGRQVSDAAFLHFPAFVRRLVDESGIVQPGRDVDMLLLHQGSRVLFERLVPYFPNAASRPTHFDRFANMAAASVPFLLDEQVRAGRIDRGDVVVMAAFGAGWVWGGSVCRWALPKFEVQSSNS